MSASATILGNLHEKVARVMLRTLERMEVDIEEASDEDIMDAVLAVEPSAAFLNAVTKFLKDNEITASAEAGNGLSKLEQKFLDMRAPKSGPKTIADMPVGSA